MAFPKSSITTLLAKYPEAEKVVQFRMATREGDVVIFEGVLPSHVAEVMMSAAFDFSLGEVAKEEQRRESPLPKETKR